MKINSFDDEIVEQMFLTLRKVVKRSTQRPLLVPLQPIDNDTYSSLQSFNFSQSFENINVYMYTALDNDYSGKLHNKMLKHWSSMLRNCSTSDKVESLGANDIFACEIAVHISHCWTFIGLRLNYNAWIH